MRRKPSKKSCHKVGYPTKDRARVALKEQRDIGVKRFYKCPYCKGGIFHLTSETNG